MTTEPTVTVLKDALALIAAGLGVSISFPAHAWVGGICLGIGAALYASRADPETDKRVWWVVIIGAFLAAHGAGLLFHWWMPTLPVQVPMAIAGFTSRYLTRSILKIAGIIEGKSDTLVTIGFAQISNIFRRYEDGTMSKTIVAATGGPSGEAAVSASYETSQSFEPVETIVQESKT